MVRSRLRHALEAEQAKTTDLQALNHQHQLQMSSMDEQLHIYQQQIDQLVLNLNKAVVS